nr:uncharacterized protein LOC111770708 [Equus caballus]
MQEAALSRPAPRAAPPRCRPAPVPPRPGAAPPRCRPAPVPPRPGAAPPRSPARRPRPLHSSAPCSVAAAAASRLRLLPLPEPQRPAVGPQAQPAALESSCSLSRCSQSRRERKRFCCGLRRRLSPPGHWPLRAATQGGGPSGRALGARTVSGAGQTGRGLGWSRRGAGKGVWCSRAARPRGGARSGGALCGPEPLGALRPRRTERLTERAFPPGGSSTPRAGGAGSLQVSAGQRGKLRLTQPARVVAWLGLRAILGRRGPEQGAGRRKSPHPREPGEVDREEGRQALGPGRPTQRCMAWLRRQDLWRRRTEKCTYGPGKLQQKAE